MPGTGLRMLDARVCLVFERRDQRVERGNLYGRDEWEKVEINVLNRPRFLIESSRLSQRVRQPSYGDTCEAQLTFLR